MRPPENRPPEHNVNRPVKQSRTPLIGIVAVALLVIVVLVWWVDWGNEAVQTPAGTGTPTGTQMDGQTTPPAGGTAPATEPTAPQQQAPADTAPADTAPAPAPAPVD